MMEEEFSSVNALVPIIGRARFSPARRIPVILARFGVGTLAAR